MNEIHWNSFWKSHVRNHTSRHFRVEHLRTRLTENVISSEQIVNYCSLQ